MPDDKRLRRHNLNGQAGRVSESVAVSRPVVAVLAVIIVVSVIGAFVFLGMGQTATVTSTPSGTSAVTSAVTSTPLGTSTVVSTPLGTSTLASSTSASQTSRSQSSSQSQTSSSGSGGIVALLLQLSLNSTSISQGHSIRADVSEFNSLSVVGNFSSKNAWPIGGLTLGSCGGTAGAPMGIAVFQGHYLASNASFAAPLRILKTSLPCSAAIKQPSWYAFQPQSSIASTSLGPGAMTVKASIGLNGTWTGGDIQGNGASFSFFSAGKYTVVAGDEWGRLAFLYFSVAA